MTREHNELDELSIPKWLKLIMVFIDRVGFPVLAFILMFYTSTVSINKVNESLTNIGRMLVEWQTSTIEFRKMAINNENIIIQNQREIQACVMRVNDRIKN